MAPVVWGLDLKEVQWSKLKCSSMWSNGYHLRRTKFVVYQCAMILCIVSESLGTAVLSDYIDSQKRVAKLDPRVHVSNNRYAGAVAFNILSGIFVATVFGAAFFFDLFWPERKESRRVLLSWQICSLLAAAISFASAFTLLDTTWAHCGRVRGPAVANEGYARDLLHLLHQYKKHGRTPLCYWKNPRCVVALVFAWLGGSAAMLSCAIMHSSISHTKKGLGSKSTHARSQDDEMGSIELTSKAGGPWGREEDTCSTAF